MNAIMKAIAKGAIAILWNKKTLKWIVRYGNEELARKIDLSGKEKYAEILTDALDEIKLRGECVSDDGKEDAPGDAEDQRVRRREDDRGREAERVDEERQEKAEHDGPRAERLDVLRRLCDVAAREQAAEVREERRIRDVDDGDEHDDGGGCAGLHHAHRFFLKQCQ